MVFQQGFVILSALLVLAAAAPQNRPPSAGSQLTSKEWEQLGNAISDIFGVDPDGVPIEQGEQQEDGSTEQDSGRSERMREFMERQRTNPSEAGRLENSEEREREAIGRAEGRLPEREARRQMNRGARRGGRQNDRQQLEELSQQKDCQWTKENGQKKAKGESKDKNYNNFPLYEFSYGVHDPETGDKKEQWEKRVGDHVKGKYSLDQPDGKTRIVEYVADDKNGFEAVVKQVDQSKRGNVKWGHSELNVAQSYSKLKKVD
ncbi:uncharacterized protein LOC131294383 [Anopheles ziemanni]|uniref:uncharacterized protein LOC131265049 n=1 Tax=Anopheles coustani TaxID=139045 RepID=UPI00265B271F|nr:uncharacterized protein LOC131265049 [Anopheles coustani]XP_058178414.1 uncharacterized protein LOC131294383 [Anopheles ziemanni]